MDARALCEAFGFQLQLDSCKHEVVIAANVGTWERSCVCFVDAVLEALGCQDEVFLVVSLPIRGMPGCCSIQLVGMDSVGKGESVARCELSESPFSVVCLSNAKFSYYLYLVLVRVRTYFGNPVALSHRYILRGSLCYDAIRLLDKLFDLLVLMV